MTLTPYYKVAASEEALSALQWWSREHNLGMLLRPFQHQAQIFTDASTQGWGAYLNSLSVQGTWGVSESRHINILEMTAVLQACQSFIAHIRDGQHHCGRVHQPSGRYSVQPHIPCCGDFPLFPIQSQCESEIPSHNRDLKYRRGEHPSPRQNGIYTQRWRSCFRDNYHRLLVDLSAIHLNNKLDVFVSHFQHHMAWEVDALNILWEGLDAYTFPPTKLLICQSKDTQTKLPYTSHSSQVNQAGLVCRVPEPTVCATLGFPLPSETVETTRVRRFSPEPMVVISQAHVQGGFSLGACSLMADFLKESTIKQYESKWKLFA